MPTKREQRSLEVCKAQLRQCAGFESDEISRDRVAALNYYLQRARGDEVPGRSGVVAGDLSASVEANLAQILAAYSSDQIAEFDADNAEDEDNARRESDAVVFFLMKSQNGLLELSHAIKDALLLRNGVMKCWIDEFAETGTSQYSDVAPEIVDNFATAKGGTVESYANGELTLRTTRLHRRFRAEAVAIENFFYPKDWDSYDLQECPFVAERHVTPRSELLRMGFQKSKVSALTAYRADANSPGGQARNVRSAVAIAAKTEDESLDPIEWFECYMLLDVNGDGIAERRRVCMVWQDGVILSDAPASLVPYAIGAVMTMPHRVTGISQYDKLRQTQDEHTGLKRALYDSVNTVVKNRVAVLEGKVNPDDLTDGRTNGAVRVTGVDNIQAAIMPFTVGDNSANILANIEALKRERSELGGAALDMAAGNLQVGGERMGSQGLDRAYSVMEQLAALMAQTFAATLLRNLFLLAHATLRLHWDRPLSVRRDDGWITSTPTQWAPRYRVTVRVGMSPGERQRQSAAFMTMLNAQMQLAQQGMDEVLVNVYGFYRTMMSWARVNDVRNPEQYFIDPRSPEAQQAFKVKAESARAEQQKREALMTRAIGTRETEVALGKYTHDSQLQYNYWERVLNSEIEEAKLVGAAATKLLEAQQAPEDSPGGPEGRRETPAE